VPFQLTKVAQNQRAQNDLTSIINITRALNLTYPQCLCHPHRPRLLCHHNRARLRPYLHRSRHPFTRRQLIPNKANKPLRRSITTTAKYQRAIKTNSTITIINQIYITRIVPKITISISKTINHNSQTHQTRTSFRRHLRTCRIRLHRRLQARVPLTFRIIPEIKRILPM
jgi:hypothetical protein